MTTRRRFNLASLADEPPASSQASQEADTPASLVAGGQATQQPDRPAPAARATGGPKVFSTRLDPDLHRRLKVYAANSGDSIEQIVNTAISRYLDTAVSPH